MITRGPEETADVGRRLGRLLRAGDVVLLMGTLGAGKTTLAQGIAAGMGIVDYVTSPTFTLVNQYRAQDSNCAMLYHADLYRIGDSAEAYELLLDEFAEDGVTVVEWAERAPEALPSEHLLVTITVAADDSRSIAIAPVGSRYQQLARVLGADESHV
jgi:tRNA threonylcarbamoyladenosine biosynthesis protein TsaE